MYAPPNRVGSSKTGVLFFKRKRSSFVLLVFHFFPLPPTYTLLFAGCVWVPLFNWLSAVWLSKRPNERPALHQLNWCKRRTCPAKQGGSRCKEECVVPNMGARWHPQATQDAHDLKEAGDEFPHEKWSF